MPIPRRRRQRGVASLLFVLIASVGLVATTMAALHTSKSAQKIQYAQHTAAQSQMNAWTGVNAISSAIASMPSAPTLTPGGAVQLAGLPSNIAATYVETRNGFMVFDVTGSSRGATTTLRAAYAFSLPPAIPNQGTYDPSGTGVTLHGDAKINGSTSFTGSGPANLYVIGGSLKLTGGTSGVASVCATGDIDLSGGINVANACTDGNLSLSGGSTVGTASAPGAANVRGTVSMSGGSGVWGTINTNGPVVLTGDAFATTTINAKGDVTVPGQAQVDSVSTEGAITWTAAAGRRLTANRTVSYTPTGGSSPSTVISAVGNVTLTDADSVTTSGSTSLTGGTGLGIRSALYGAGNLTWTSGGAVVGSGTIGGTRATTPLATNVKVIVLPGYRPPITAFTMPPIVTFTPNNLVVDAYALKPQANFEFQGVDTSGNPRVAVTNINGVTDGTYFVARNSAAGSENWLCKVTSGTTCSAPVARICGVSGAPGSKCFAYAGGAWTLSGTLLPSVAWFQGSLTLSVGQSPSIATLIATGDITVANGNDTYAPNFAGAAAVCSGQAYTPPAASGGAAVASLSSLSMSANNRATQLCSGSSLTGVTLANNALVSGGYSNNVYSGGSVLVKGSAVLGSILAGDTVNTSAHSYVAGAVYSGDLGTAKGGNTFNGGATFSTTGAAAAFNASMPTCLTNCGQPQATRPANNIVWVSPI